MNIKLTLHDIGAIITLGFALAAPASVAAKYYLDTQYMTQEEAKLLVAEKEQEFNGALLGAEVRGLKREIRRLERYGDGLTQEDKWYLDDLRNELEDLQELQ